MMKRETVTGIIARLFENGTRAAFTELLPPPEPPPVERVQAAQAKLKPVREHPFYVTSRIHAVPITRNTTRKNSVTSRPSRYNSACLR